MEKTNKRDPIFDELKGIAIILVVAGHSIQFGSGVEYLHNQMYFDNILFKIIYSFHMPLFSLISGYFLYWSLQRNTVREIWVTRISSIGVPLISWSLINYVIGFLQGVRPGGVIGYLKQYIWTLILTLWFLWAILFCVFAVLLIHKFFEGRLIVFLTVFILLFIIPDSYNLMYFKFLFPFYAVGYLWNRYCKYPIYEILKDKWIIWLVFYAFLMIFFSTDVYIYNSGFTLIGHNLEVFGKQIFIDLYRCAVGFAGVFCVIGLWKNARELINVQIIASIGKSSLGIYIFNSYWNTYILQKLCEKNINTVYILAETGCGIMVCYLATRIVMRNRVLRKLLLGMG